MKRRFTGLLSATFLAAIIANTATAQSFPGSFPGSSPFRGPDEIAFSLGTLLSDDGLTVMGAGGPERVNLDSPFYGNLMLLWLVAAAAAASKDKIEYGKVGNAAAGQVWGIRAGIESSSHDVESFQVGAAVFPTAGSYDFTGIFVGGQVEMPLSKSSRNPVQLGFGADIGYGDASIDAFGGGFSRDADGIYFRLEAFLSFPVSDRVNIEPGILYRSFDHGDIDDDSVLATIRTTFKF
jgi:hypothetical protein